MVVVLKGRNLNVIYNYLSMTQHTSLTFVFDSGCRPHSSLPSFRLSSPPAPPLPSCPYLPFFPSLTSFLPPPLFFLISPVRSRTPYIQLEVWEHCSSPTEFGSEPQPKSNLVHYRLDIWHLAVAILMTLSRSISCSLNGKGKSDPTMPQKWSGPDIYGQCLVN